LRQEFDRSFAQAPRVEIEHVEKLLAVRLGNDPYAIRLAEIGGLYADRCIMPLPTPVPALLGIAGFRGQIAPVYDLAALLGYARQAPPRWLILTQLRDPVALAFDAFEAHFVVPAEQIVKTPDETSAAPAATRPHLSEVVHIDGAARPIIHLQSLLENIQRQGNLPIRPGSDQS
jgi:chemotaxis signal transduction protein